jgi:hypothetical protein
MTGTNNEQYEATPGELLDALIDFSRKTKPTARTVIAGRARRKLILRDQAGIGPHTEG